MAFEWDRRKNAANLAKHRIDFEDAVRIFDGPVLESSVERYGEIRTVAFGTVDDHEIVVVYTMRGQRRRIISARRAHRRERKAYREAYPKKPPAR